MHKDSSRIPAIILLVGLNFVLQFPTLCNAANIGLFCIFASQSHTGIFYPIADELIKRGHNVTFFSSFKPISKRKGLTEIYVENVEKFLDENLPPFFTKDGINPEFMTQAISTMKESDRVILSSKAMRDLWLSSEMFDVSVLDASMQDCILPLVHNKSRSVVYLAPTVQQCYPQRMWSLGVPVPYSYVPTNSFVKFSDKMSFYERLVNVFLTFFYIYQEEFVNRPRTNEYVQKYMPGLVSIREVERNMPLILINGHPAINYPAPSAPMIKHIGGLHIKDNKPLPTELETFIKESGDVGFIYVSFGTRVPAKHMPTYAKKAFVEAFSRIPQRVIWKFDDDIPELSSNVMLVKWAPQQDLLAHPKIKAFMTHGGIFGFMETVHYGVPIIGAPVIYDQLSNVEKAVEYGMGVSLSWETLTADDVVEAVNKVTNDPRYKENAIIKQKLFRDNLIPPAQEAAYWLEYVIRHQGSLHLRLPVDHLNLAQYFLLDVLAVILVIISVVILMLYKIIRLLYLLISRSRSPAKKTTKLN